MACTRLARYPQFTRAHDDIEEDDNVNHDGSGQDDLVSVSTQAGQRAEPGKRRTDAPQGALVDPPSQQHSDDLEEDGEVGLSPVDAERVIAALIHREAWSGALPAPVDFYQYRDADRERMMAWNDAGTSDESRRQDKLVDATIEQARANSRFLRWLLGGSFLCAVAAYVWTQDLRAAALFLGAPVVTQLASVIPDLVQARTAGHRDRKAQ